MLFAVNTGDAAKPLESLVACADVPPPANVPLAPFPAAAAVNVTATPLTGLPPLSFTVACRELKAVLTGTLWLAPPDAVSTAAGPGWFVRTKLAVEAVAEDATTLYGPPTMLLAVKTGAVATPLALVVACAVAPPPANVPLAPVAGAVNVTTAPLTRFPPLSFTVAWKAVANALVMAAFCGVPAVAVMLAAGPDRIVKLNVAEVALPEVALTVNGPPTIAFAVRVGAVATPLELVVACAEIAPPENVPLAPFPAAVTVNVTVAPLTRLPPLSFTVATRDAKAVLIATD